MEVQFSPNSIDEPNLLYKLQRKLKCFNASPLPNRGYNLITSSSKYGLVFTASPEGILSVYYLRDLVNKDCELPEQFPIQLQERPTHISVSCDQELLVVTGGGNLYIYKVKQFQEHNVLPAISIPCQSQSYICSLQWNPCMPDVIAVAFFDGSLLVAAVASNQVMKIQAKARCICWSPKGKQVVTGNSDGTLSQYKPDLTLTKSVPAPNLFEGAPVECLAIHWISTFQFVAVYRNAVDDSRPSLTVVNTPKGGQPVCINYEDICYSMNTDRPWYYYLQSIAPWNMVLASSSNSIEIATLGSTDSTNWIQWTQTDEGRPELPLSGKEDNYPVGMCIDNCAIHQLPWGENETLGPMPLLLILTHSGLLVVYNIINLISHAPSICVPLEPLTLPQAVMTKAIFGEPQTQTVAPPAPEPIKPTALIIPKPQIQQGPVYNQSAPPTMAASRPPEYVPPSAPVPIRAVQAEPRIQAEIKPLPPQPLPVQVFSPTIQRNDILPPIEPQPVLKSSAEINISKEESERSTLRANKELNSMLIKEVNDFQMELNGFLRKSYDIQMQYAKQVSQVEPSLDLRKLNTESLRRECWLEHIKEAIVRLKLELVKACAVVAESRTYNDSKDLEQWSQPDPLTAKRLTSIKTMLYYIECQLQRANKELDHKATQIINYNDRSGPRMIRPILDDVYQPLVKQQEIISRQEVVLKVLKNTLSQCDILPWKSSTSLLRSTPFKKDQLSKLTKNLLDMSIEPEKNNSLSCGLTPQKLESLRDMLINHKTTRIQPVNVEMREHYATLRSKYEEALKEKVIEEQLRNEALGKVKNKAQPKPVEVKADLFVSATTKVPAETPAAPNLNSVARTLFTDVKNKPQPKPVEVKADLSLSATTKVPAGTPAAPNLNSVARTLFIDDKAAQNKAPLFSQTPSAFGAVTPANASAVPFKPQPVELKNDHNTFMGQKICAPTISKTAEKSAPFVFSTFQTTNAFAPNITKPNELPSSSSQPQTYSFAKKILSAETGEDEVVPKNSIANGAQKNKENVATKQFPAFSTANQNIPDVLKSNEIKTEKVEVKAKISSDNSIQPEKPVNSATSTVSSNLLPSAPQTSLKVSIPTTLKLEPKETNKENTASSPSASSIFAAANKTSPVKSPTATSPTGSIFATTTSPTSSGSIFGLTPKSIFGSTLATSTMATVTKTDSQTIIKPATKITSAVSSANGAVKPASTPTQNIEATANINIAASTTITPTTSPQLFGTSTQNNSTPTTKEPTQGFVPPLETKSSESTQAVSSAATPVDTTSQSSIFGAAPTKSSIFGSATSTNQTSGFGTPTTTQASFFGTPTATTQASIFGATSPSQGSIFGQPTATTQSSLFGSSTTTTQSSIFGSASQTTTQGSIFGFSSTPTTTQGSLFGSSTTPTTTQGSIFGSSPAQTTNQGSIFASATPTTQESVFGSPAASVFGSQSSSNISSIFEKANTDFKSVLTSISATSASQANAGNIFGGGFNKSSGFGGSIFGSKPAQTPPSNIFGGSSTFGQTPPATNLFGGATNTTGFASSTFGQQQTTPQGQSIFGTPSGFGGSFSGGNPGQGFGTPTQQAGAFGASPQQNASAFGGSGFGAKPVFGQPTGFSSFSNKSPTSGFGSAATFGGSPGFSSAATFGNTSPGKLFGNSPQAFTQSSPTSMTFESLATQDTISFGNLAQQTQQQEAPKPPTFQSSSFTGWRG